MATDFPKIFFDRIDESVDAAFYATPRLVQHIDETTIDALRAAYRELLPEGARVLDLMSSWVSHLPEERHFARVEGLGMNAEELAENPRLDAHCVHDLNRDPELPYPDGHFDAVVNAVSVQYLVQPVSVFASIARVLRPGGLSVVAMSHRCFPTKAIRAFHGANGEMRMAIVQRYYELAGGFAPPEALDRSPATGDPLWIVVARKSGP